MQNAQQSLLNKDSRFAMMNQSRAIDSKWGDQSAARSDIGSEVFMLYQTQFKGTLSLPALDTNITDSKQTSLQKRDKKEGGRPFQTSIKSTQQGSTSQEQNVDKTIRVHDSIQFQSLSSEVSNTIQTILDKRNKRGEGRKSVETRLASDLNRSNEINAKYQKNLYECNSVEILNNLQKNAPKANVIRSKAASSLLTHSLLKKNLLMNRNSSQNLRPLA